MQYPLNSEYLSSIRMAEDTLKELTHLTPVMDNFGEPTRSSGAFAIVFKMQDKNTGKYYALKCFTADQPGRAEAYRMIADELDMIDSPYITSVKYLEDELFVESSSADGEEFPVLLMDWVEGVTMDKYISENVTDSHAMAMLCYRFCRMAAWLRSQPFAHGDLKPDNIIVRTDGTLALVDYDGMYVPAMRGQKSPTLGTRDFTHPERTADDFDETIDDFALASIALSLKAISLDTSLYSRHNTAEGLLLSHADYIDLSKSKVIDDIKSLLWDKELLKLYGLFMLAHAEKNLFQTSFRLFGINKPEIKEEESISTAKPTDEELVEAFVDEYGVKYSKDGKRLLQAPLELQGDYVVRKGTKVICDEAFSKEYDTPIPFWGPLTSISLPDTLTTIGYCAFNYCDKLSSMTLPQSLKEIHGNPFQGLKIQVTSDSPNFVVEDDVLYTSNRKKLIAYLSSKTEFTIPNGITKIGDEAFKHCTSLFSIKLPDTLTELGDSAFFCCYSLTNINLPSGLTTIGHGAFNYCGRLSSITLPKSLKEIHGNPFRNHKVSVTSDSPNFIMEDDVLYTADKKKLIAYLSSKTEFTAPSSVVEICKSAFYGNSALVSVNLPCGMTKIGENAFAQCNHLKSINLPNGLTTIGNSTFRHCKSLTSINLPEKLTAIDNNTFEGCSSLTNINIPNGLTTIGDWAFYDCSSLSCINLPNGLTTINQRTFCGCRSLKSIELPDKLMTIGNGAFSWCTALTNINLPETLTIIDNEAFAYCNSLTNITFSCDSTSMKSGVFKNCHSLRSISVTHNNTFSEYNKDGKLYLGCPILYNIEDNQVKEGVQIICDRSFNGLHNEIDDFVLHQTNLVIPSTVKYIGKNVFSSEIASITSKSKYFIVENEMLLSADRKRLYRYFGNQKEFEIPNYIEEIIGGAFVGLEIESIVIPQSVTVIGDNPFASTAIYIDGKYRPCRIVSHSQYFVTDENSIIDIKNKRFIAYFGTSHYFRIPYGLKEIDADSFFGSDIKTILVPDSVEVIHETAFYWTSLKEIVVANGSIRKFLEILPEYLRKFIIDEMRYISI